MCIAAHQIKVSLSQGLAEAKALGVLGPSTAAPPSSAAASAQSAGTPQQGFTAIIRGTTLEPALEHHREDLSRLLLAASSVVCCRVTPKQKAELVKIVKDAGFMTLSIGDGGNDVSMIQEAHVGVGIRGKEGLQASRASDYTVVPFKSLRRLLLVHGRYSYYRTSLVAQYSFYKSFYFCLLQIGDGFVSGFAGVSLFNSLCVAAYNALLFVPVVFFFVRFWGTTRVIASWIHKPWATTHWLAYMQAFFDPSQGFFNGLLFVVCSPETLRAFGEQCGCRRPRRPTTRSPDLAQDQDFTYTSLHDTANSSYGSFTGDYTDDEDSMY